MEAVTVPARLSPDSGPVRARDAPEATLPSPLLDVRALTANSSALALALTHFEVSVPVTITPGALAFLQGTAVCLTPQGQLLPPLDFLATRLDAVALFLPSAAVSIATIYADALDTVQLACTAGVGNSAVLCLYLQSEEAEGYRTAGSTPMPLGSAS